MEATTTRKPRKTLRELPHKPKKYFSAFGEDVFILHHLKKMRQGVYVDIGALHPFSRSNTALLHKRGWRGINVDLNEEKIDIFNELRPEDINVVSAIGDREDVIDYYDFGDRPALNSISHQFAEVSRRKFNAPYVVKKVQMMRMDTLLEQHKDRLNEGRFNFLNIDVEGAEKAVLSGFSIGEYLPDVIAIELHTKDLRGLVEHDVTRLLESHGYRLIAKYFVTAMFVR